MLLTNPHIDVNVPASQSQEGVSALIGAAYKGHTKIVKMLLDFPKIDVNYQDAVGRTALWTASVYGHTETVKSFLACTNIQVNLQTK
eukprot:gene39265-biopygen28102